MSRMRMGHPWYFPYIFEHPWYFLIFFWDTFIIFQVCSRPYLPYSFYRAYYPGILNSCFVFKWCILA